MGRRIAAFLFAACSLGFWVNATLADVVITLEAFLENGEPVAGPVAPGTDVVVDVLLSVDAEDDPLPHVRLIQFDFEDTNPQIQLGAFTWTVDANAYSFQDPDFPITNVTSIYISPGPGILTLTTEPVKVASADVVINGAGTLDVVNPDNTDASSGIEVRARFDAPGRFSAILGNLEGGDLDFSVTGGGGGPDPGDQDGDGVPNDDDAFPDDPDEDTDTNDDGVGDNADPDDDSDGAEDEVDDFPVDSDETTDTDDDDIGNNADPDDDNDGVEDADDDAPLDPDDSDDGGGGAGGPRMCGAGMLGPSLLLFMGLGLMAFRPRRNG